MKYSVIVLALAALATAQTNNIPPCAVPCINDAAAKSTNCGPTDYACQCEPANQQKIQQAATSCVIAACGSQAGDVLTAAQQFCASQPPASAPPPATGGNPPPAQGGNPPPAQGGNPPPAQGGNPPPAQGGNPPPAQGGNPPPAQGGNPPPAQGTAPAAPAAPANGAQQTVTVTVCPGAPAATTQASNTTKTWTYVTPTAPVPAKFTGGATQVGAGLGGAVALGLAVLLL